MEWKKAVGLMGLAAVISTAGYVGYRNSFAMLEENQAIGEYRIHSYEPKPKLKIGAYAPDINIESFNGKGKVNLSELEDKVVLLDFGATWCGPCRALTPEIKQLYADYKDKGLEVIQIATNGQEKEDLRKYLQKQSFDYPVVHDEDKRLKEAYSVNGIPRLVLIKNGKVEAISEGTGTNTDDLLARIKKELSREW